MELGGVILGVSALVGPVWYLSRRMRGGKKRPWVSIASLGCCSLSLWDQLLFQAHLAAQGNVSAWQDTAGVAVGVSGFLLLAALALNAFLLKLDAELARAGQ